MVVQGLVTAGVGSRGTGWVPDVVPKWQGENTSGSRHKLFVTKKSLKNDLTARA